MRTAITLHRKKDGWHLASGPDVRSDKQSNTFRNIGGAWPKDVEEVLFQFNDGKARRVIKDKAQNLAKQISEAVQRAEDKAALAEKREKEEKAAQIKAAEDRKKADEIAHAKAVKAKEEAKKAPK